MIRKKLGEVVSPTSVVLLQELERFNKLIRKMAISLNSLQKVSTTSSALWVDRANLPNPKINEPAFCFEHSVEGTPGPIRSTQCIHDGEQSVGPIYRTMSAE